LSAFVWVLPQHDGGEKIVTVDQTGLYGTVEASRDGFSAIMYGTDERPIIIGPFASAQLAREEVLKAHNLLIG